MNSARARQGFTLFELMVAIVVIAFALMGVLSATLHNGSTKEALRELEVAKEAADRKIDELRGLPWGGIKTGYAQPSIVNTYFQAWQANGAFPYTFTIAGESPFSVLELTHPYTANKLGKGTVIIHGANYATNAGVPVDPIYAVDFEVQIEWYGVRGRRQYSSRMMISKDNSK